MKVCAISDLHGYLPQNLPEAEILVICGDIVSLDVQRDIPASAKWFRNRFLKWVRNQKFEKIFAIGGNHDFFLNNIYQFDDYIERILYHNDKFELLEDTKSDYISNDGQVYTIYGTPWCHEFGRWAFMLLDPALEMKYKNIPKDVDILLCHDAPYGVSDQCLEETFYNYKQTNAEGKLEFPHIGNVPLREAIEQKTPKVVLHGHLHSSNHECEMLNETKVYNVSSANEQYKHVYKPLIFEI